MSKFITGDVEQQARSRLQSLTSQVTLIYFTQTVSCGACREQQTLLEELVQLSDMLKLQVRDLTTDAADAKTYGIDKVPATIVRNGHDPGIRFFGLTGGFEFTSLLDAIVMVATGNPGLAPEIERIVRAVTKPLHLEIIVTLGCPYCPRMVRLAHQMAFLNTKIRSDMIDAAEFPTLVERYHVHGVPRTIVNGRPAFEGALPAGSAVMEILREVDPDAYDHVDGQQRQHGEERRATAADKTGSYEIIVIGAGPAGMAAALYATRKGRRTVLIGRQAGGQINDTAVIENYLGFPQIGGHDLAERMRSHVETYPVSERCHTAARRIDKATSGFEVETEDGARYHGQTVIYAAGQQYRHLGVPGEVRFIGHGIAFCATCDAPLYRDKKVAVVGGGNSAFTAARDLLPFAREIHLIHRLEVFQADPVLVEQVKKSARVTIHKNMEVLEFIGRTELTGIRLATVGGGDRYDLAVEGVFLEIGLAPNSVLVKNLVTLNAHGEIPVDKDQSTELPGFFAAGDVTDDNFKQVSIAAGAGARAALAADRFLGSLQSPAVQFANQPSKRS